MKDKFMTEAERLTIAYMDIDVLPVRDFAIIINVDPKTVKTRYPRAILPASNGKPMMIKKSLIK